MKWVSWLVKILGVLSCLSHTTFAIPVRELIVDRSLIRPRTMAVTPYHACPTVRAILADALENYSDSSPTLVMADAMDERGFSPDSAGLLVRSQSWSTDAETTDNARSILRGRAKAVRDMTPAIAGRLPKSYEGPLLLSRGIIAGGELTPDHLTRRTFPFRHFQEAFSAVRVVNYSEERLPKKFLEKTRWLEIRGYGTNTHLVDQSGLLKDKALVHLGYEDLYISERSVEQLVSLKRQGKLRSSESLRELSLKNVMFSTIDTYIDFLELFPNIEVLSLSTLSVHTMYPYVFIPPRSQGSHFANLQRRCETVMAETDFGTLFPNLKVIRLRDFRHQGDLADLESYLFPRTPYQHLQEIDLNNSTLTADFMRAVTNLVRRTPSIRRLDLANENDSGFDFDFLTPGVLKNLQELDIRYQFEGNVGGWLKRVPSLSLRRLWVDGVEGMGDAELVYLVQSRKFADLYDLSVAETQVTAEGIKQIARLKALQRFAVLDFSDLKLGGTGAVVDLLQSGNLEGLVSLRLYNTELTEADLLAIAAARLPFLQNLELSISRTVTRTRAAEILGDYINDGATVRID